MPAGWPRCWTPTANRSSPGKKVWAAPFVLHGGGFLVFLGGMGYNRGTIIKGGGRMGGKKAAKKMADSGDWLRAHRRLWQFAALCIACLLALGWGFWVTTQAANDRPDFAIVNDDYTRTLAPADPAAGFCQQITAGPDTPLYGVRLLFTTYDRVARGTLTAELLDDTGRVLARAGCEMTELLDNTFTALIFDTPVYPAAADTSYTLHIYTASKTPQDIIGLWCSETALPGFALYDAASEPQAGQALGTAALQYVVDYTGAWASKLYWIPAALLALAVLGGFWLALRKAAPGRVFLFAGAVLGLCFALVTPPLAAPDEYSHAAASYAMASRALGQPDFDAEGRLYMRECDAPYMTRGTGEVGMFAYKRLAEHLGETGCAGEVSAPVRVSAPYKPVPLPYLAPTAGVLLARVLGLGFYGMLLFGRLANLIQYLLLAGFAVRHIPRGKTLLFCVSLLPMSLQLAASFSPDSLVLGLSFALLALVLECAAQKSPVSRRQTAGLVVLSALIAPCKAIYLGMAALCFLIPAGRFALPGARLSALRRSRLIKFGCCGAALLCWCFYHAEYLGYTFRDLRLGALPYLLLAAGLAAGLWYALRGPEGPLSPKMRRALFALGGAAVLGGAVFLLLFVNMGGDYTPEQLLEGMQPNGDSIYTWSAGYLLRHLPGLAKLLAATFTDNAPALLQGLVGTALGEPIVFTAEASWVYTLLLAALLGLAALRGVNDAPRLSRGARWLLALELLLAAGLSVLACLMWTPINYSHLFGLQGRYFLPVLPMALLLLGETDLLALKTPAGAALRFCSVTLTALVLLQAVGLYAAM